MFFFYGLRIGEKIRFAIPNKETGEQLQEVQLTRVGPPQAKGMRTLTFLVNGETRTATVKDATVDTGACDLPVADAADPRQIGSPMPGKVEAVYVSANAKVSKGDRLMLVSAMKMEVVVKAPYDGVIKELAVAQGDRVDQGTLVVRMEPAKGAQLRDSVGIDSLASGLSDLAKPTGQ